MKTKLLYLFTRTPLHVGAGSSVGAIDQPVQRERPTGFPIIPGSSIKGVLRDACRRSDDAASENTIFGTQEEAGRISFGDAKILAFPVRSAKGSFAFVTCPLALERFRRENDSMAGLDVPPSVKDMHCFAGCEVVLTTGIHSGVVLEEYRFNKEGDFPSEWEKALLGLLDDVVWKKGEGRFVLLSDGDFSHFVKNACEVAQHVAINPKTGTAKEGALFNLEAVPAETIFFAPLVSLARQGGELDDLAKLIARQPLMQFGGDSTTGLGFCTAKLA
jgi:CRISPR-associated protein Cmr4